MRACTRNPKNMDTKPLQLGTRKNNRKIKCKCIGGALSGHSLFLNTAGTMAFTLNGMRGFYSHKMEWVAL